MSAINQILNLNQIIPIINIILILIGALIVYTILKKVISYYWRKYEIDLTGYHLFQDLIKYIIILVALAWILKEIGIDLHGIFISVGVAGIVIGLAAKDIFSNLMSGILIINDQTIKKDEIIEINNVKGKVEKITFRTTTIKTVDDFTVVIPNNLLNNREYTVFKDFELNKIKIFINIPYNIKIEEFEEEYRKQALSYPWTLKNKNPHIEDVELTEYGYKIKYYIWVDDYSKMSQYKIILAQDAEKIIEKIGTHLKISA